MLITPITNPDGTIVAYTAEVYHRGRFIGVFSNPTRLLVIKNAMLRIDIMEMLSKFKMGGESTAVPVRCLC